MDNQKQIIKDILDLLAEIDFTTDLNAEFTYFSTIEALDIRIKDKDETVYKVWYHRDAAAWAQTRSILRSILQEHKHMVAA